LVGNIVICDYLGQYVKQSKKSMSEFVTDLDTVEGFMQKLIFVNELCRCACACASVIHTANTTMSVTRKKTFVISKCSESIDYNTGDEH
jgi:hypothetical protein